VKIRIRSVLAGAAALAIATGVLVGTGVAASAAVTPAWEPDPNALGSLTLYNASGAPITSGSVNDHPAAFYLAASGAGRPGDSLAQAWLSTPQVGADPSNWSKDVMSGATTYPNTSAPANIAALTTPVASPTTQDLSIADYISEFPNNLTVAGYQNLYEFRVYTSSASNPAPRSYFRTDIQVDPTAGTWTVVFPVAAATTTTLAASPASPQPSGTVVTLTATVAPATAGSVHFFDGATDLGAGTYNAGTGVATLQTTPASGSHSFTAQFTSSDAGFGNSTSTAVPYTITGTPTNTTLTASPSSPAAGDASGNVTATLTANVTPVNTAGNVHFFDGNTDLGAGTYSQATGVATLTTVINAAGSPHQLTATFTPTSTTFSPSTSLILSYSVIPPNAGTASVPLSATDNTPPFAGSLTLVVAAGTSVNFTQVDPTTTAGHPVDANDPTGHRHAWVFNGNLSGVSVVDTRQSEFGWTLTGQASNFTGPAAITATQLGWVPAKVATGSDAEGTVNAGPSTDSSLKTVGSKGLSTPTNLAQAPAGNGLGTQNVSAALELRITDQSQQGTYTSTLTLTLLTP
jgi:Big-like domain-containing protein